MKKFISVLYILIAFQSISQTIGWTYKPLMPGSARVTGFHFQINDKFYVGGGGDYGFNVPKSDLYEYNPQTDTWQSRSDIGYGGVGISAHFALNGKGYVVCPATNTSTNNNTVWQYDPSANTWTQKNNFPVNNGLSDIFAFVANGSAYVGISTGTNSTVYQYNEISDAWTQKASLGNLSTHQSFGLNNKGYVLANCANAAGAVSAMYEYNPTNDQWTQKNNAPFGRKHASCVSNSESGYLVGGNVPSGGITYCTQFTYKYNPVTDAWTQVPNSILYETMIGAAFTGSNNRLYYTCGIQGSGTSTVTNQLWESTFEVGMEENASSDQFNIYPNPVNDKLIIELHETAITITITDVIGKEVYRLKDAEGRQEVDVKELSSGIYFLRVGDFVKKIIKE
jgi:N-acetylneuraminic acid mutarotase